MCLMIYIYIYIYIYLGGSMYSDDEINDCGYTL